MRFTSLVSYKSDTAIRNLEKVQTLESGEMFLFVARQRSLDYFLFVTDDKHFKICLNRVQKSATMQRSYKQ
jgi:hypothetical protein